MKRLLSALAVLAATPTFGAQEAVVANGTYRLRPGDGCVRVEFDPTGKGRYLPRGALLRPFRQAAPADVRVEGGALRITGGRAFVPNVARGGYGGPFDHGEDLPPTGTLGQSFTVPAGGPWLSDVWALLTCSGVADSAVTMTLRRGGPAGPLVASRRVRPLPNDSEVHLPLPQPAEPGLFYLEIGEKHGGAYWWGCNTDKLPDGQAYINGVAQPGKDWRLGFEMAQVTASDWTLRLEGRKLVVAGASPRSASAAAAPALALEFPWKRDGYDTSSPATTPFRSIVTDTGYWLPVHAFKRLEADWALEPACAEARLQGANGCDLTLAHARGALQPRMDADRLSLLIGSGGSLEARPAGAALPPHFPRFFTSDPARDALINEFLLTYLTSHTSCPSTYEFDTLKLAWVGGPIHDSLERVLLHYTFRIDPDGFIWSRGDSRGWDGGDCATFDSRHYDGNTQWILACRRWFCWTGDRAFLAKCLPTVRKATGYLLNALHGETGLLTIGSKQHAGVEVDGVIPWPSDYWDCIPAGHQVAYINAFYAPTLRAAAELERAAGDPARATELERLADRAREQFNAAFWDEKAGRYIGWIDAKGGKHDPGMTHVNLIAATHGLAGKPQVQRMMRWMTLEPTASGKPDTFTRWVFAPRSNTLHCAEQYNRYKYEDWCEDGGAILWTAYYEIMARALWLGADDAWARFGKILGRFAEPDHLVGGNPLYRGEINNHGGPPGSVGVWGEFPESGITPAAFLYAFVGVDADLRGLHVRPRLPKGLQFAGVDGLVFHGQRLKVTAYRDKVVVQWRGGRLVRKLKPGGEALITAPEVGRP